MAYFQRIFYLALLFFCLPAHAVLVTFTDWAIACDNIRHCEATGYQAETEDLSVVLFLSRDAGPATPLSANIMVGMDDILPGKLTVRIGKVVVSGLSSGGKLTQAQINTLLPQMLNGSKVSISDGKNNWMLSLTGIKAALLKMDEQQGRVGTPSALVRKGSKPESSVPLPLPIPVLVAAKIPPTKLTDKLLLKPILNVIKDRECWENLPDNANPEVTIHRLSDKLVLIRRECGRGAYQSGSSLWISNDTPPYDPHRPFLPNGPLDNYVMNADFNDGTLDSYEKDRGLGDCMSMASWLD